MYLDIANINIFSNGPKQSLFQLSKLKAQVLHAGHFNYFNESKEHFFLSQCRGLTVDVLIVVDILVLQAPHPDALVHAEVTLHCSGAHITTETRILSERNYF